MGRIGRILPIQKEYNKLSTSLDACLSSHGFTRFPGTHLKIGPAKAPNGDFITGLDPNAAYIRRMPKEAAEIERKRVTDLRQDLEAQTGLDLSPRAPYYKEMFNDSLEQSARATYIMLKDEPNIFNLDNPYEAITWAWLCRHPLIASSYQAWERGEYPSSTKFYVADEDVEQEIAYKKHQEEAKAISMLESMSIEDRKKVARLLGKPVKDDTKETFVYNVLYKWIKQSEIGEGQYRGGNPITIFMNIAQLDSKILAIRDLIAQAISLDIYRKDPDGTLREGGHEIAKNESDYAIELCKSKNQDKVVVLSDKVSAKKLLEYN